MRQVKNGPAPGDFSLWAQFDLPRKEREALVREACQRKREEADRAEKQAQKGERK